MTSGYFLNLEKRLELERKTKEEFLIWTHSIITRKKSYSFKDTKRPDDVKPGLIEHLSQNNDFSELLPFNFIQKILLTII